MRHGHLSDSGRACLQEAWRAAGHLFGDVLFLVAGLAGFVVCELFDLRNAIAEWVGRQLDDC